MPITKELMEQAIKTGHQPCTGAEGCIHAEAAADCRDLIAQEILKAVLRAADNPVGPGMGIFYHGLHIGYRLRQLETEPQPKSSVN